MKQDEEIWQRKIKAPNADWRWAQIEPDAWQWWQEKGFEVRRLYPGPPLEEVSFNPKERPEMAPETDETRKARTDLSSVRMTDDESRAVQKTPHRVTLDFMLSQIESEEYLHPSSISHMTILILTLKNGFAVVGTSAPADASNFNEELGRKFSKEDCIRQMWRLYGFALREKLAVS